MSTPSASLPAPIGVFDSGVGGLSVLRAIRQRLPRHPLLYVADSGHAPYGERGDSFVQERTLEISRFLLEYGAATLVVACNTATAAAVRALRERYPELPIVGVEPGVKPAAERTRNQRIGVMATTGTLHSERFRLLAQAHAAHVQLVLQPCPGLAAAIEAGDLDAPEVRRLVAEHCLPLQRAGVDTVVLGCTHYPFVKHHIQAALGPEVALIDTSEAVARQTALVVSSQISHTSVLPSALDCEAPEHAPEPPVEMWSSGTIETLRTVTRNWLGWQCGIHVLDTGATAANAA